MQYTIRNITDEIDQAARDVVQREGLTLNEALLRALRSGFGVEERPRLRRRLPPSFDGTPLEPEVLRALEEQRQVDPREWN
jgi:hypothetical protein